MKVLNLQCSHEHTFEGWFASEEDYTSQLERGLVSCPLCGDASIRKLLSAPRLNLRLERGDPPNRPDQEMLSLAGFQSRDASFVQHENDVVELDRWLFDQLAVSVRQLDRKHKLA